MSNGDRAWDRADAWMFAIIDSAEGRYPLAELLGAANHVNPFVLADGQFEFTLGRLVGSGLVRVYDDWSLEVTDEGASLIEDCSIGDPDRVANIQERLSFVDPIPTKLKVPQKLLDAALHSQ